ncbi:MAG TPA: hypothetical protein VK851_14165, partial [Anaerolineales bacterium]|nr:hypothetical protein [Anaerolineales bacterium]
MTVLNSTTVEKFFAGKRILLSIILIALPGAAAIGLLMASEPLLATGVLLSIPLLLAFIKWPDAATLLVVFYIYTNVGPVLMSYHGVPSYIAQGFPVLLS